MLLCPEAPAGPFEMKASDQEPAQSSLLVSLIVEYLMH